MRWLHRHVVKFWFDWFSSLVQPSIDQKPPDVLQKTMIFFNGSDIIESKYSTGSFNSEKYKYKLFLDNTCNDT